MLGAEPAGPWLWQQHNEHRMLLSRLIYYPLFQITHDFRAGMFLQIAMMSAISLGLMTLAAKLRGRPAWPDAFFPVSLLHLGHWENFIMGYQICFALFLALVTGLVVVALRTTRETAFCSGVWAGVLTLLVALTGGSGLVMSLPVVAWILYLAVIVARDGQKARAITLIVLAFIPVAYIGLYSIGYQRPPGHQPPSLNPLAVVPVAGEVLAMALGVGVSGVWWFVFAVEFVLSIATVMLLIRENREDRTSALGLIAVAFGVCGVALAIGVGRAPMGLSGLWSRYAFLAWPLLGLIYLVWAKAGRKWVPMLLCVAAAIAFQTNTFTGLIFGTRIHSNYEQVESDSLRGVPVELIVQQNFPDSMNSGQMDRACVAFQCCKRRTWESSPLVDTERETNSMLLLAGLGGVVVLVFAVRWGWHLCKAVQTERARELFRLQHERFEEQLLKAASATGLPRGLCWVKCQITGDAVLVRDMTNGGIVAWFRFWCSLKRKPIRTWPTTRWLVNRVRRQPCLRSTAAHGRHWAASCSTTPPSRPLQDFRNSFA